MRKTALKIFSAIMSIALFFATASACDKGLPRLEAPANLKEEEGIITWNAVENATGYVLDINGTLIECGTALDFYLTPDYTGLFEIKVKALGDGENYADSPFSQPITVIKSVKLAQPLNLRLNNGVLIWNAVENASGYVLKLGEEEIEVSQNQFTLRKTDLGQITAMVKAKGDGVGFTESEYSLPLTFTRPVQLSAPTGIGRTGRYIYWDTVPGASGYVISVEGTEYAAEEAQYELPAEPSSRLLVKVKAKGDGENYSDSPFSEEVNLGFGSQYSPVLIYDEEDFLAIASDLSMYYKLMADIILTAPLDVFGTKDRPFTGFLDGNGHSVSGLYIDTNVEYVGLFAVIDGGEVKNITISGAIDAACSNGVGYLGGLAGVLKNGYVNGVTLNLEIDCSHYVAGGFLGMISGADRTVEITRCGFVGKLKVSGGADSWAGGFVGRISSNYTDIQLSYVNAQVEAPSVAGGFVGYMGYGKITNCYVWGTVHSTSSVITRAGGFIGHAEGYNIKVEKCYTAADVTSEQSANNLTAGFVALTPEGTYATLYKDCYYKKVGNMDRIGQGRGDGITAKSHEELSSGSLPGGFDSGIWQAEAGNYPVLK